MPLNVTINGTSYPIPIQGDTPPWGDTLENAIVAITTVLNSLDAPGDILLTSFTIVNNQSSLANITGLSFDPTSVRSAIVEYSIYRSSNTPNELSEAGQLMVTYSSVAGTWEVAQYNVGNSGVTFSMTNGGSIQYKSTDIGSGAYIGKMRFRARAYSQ